MHIFEFASSLELKISCISQPFEWNELGDFFEKIPVKFESIGSAVDVIAEGEFHSEGSSVLQNLFKSHMLVDSLCFTSLGFEVLSSLESRILKNVKTLEVVNHTMMLLPDYDKDQIPQLTTLILENTSVFRAQRTHFSNLKRIELKRGSKMPEGIETL